MACEFLDRIRPLIDCTTFPITRNAINTFSKLKTDFAKVSLHPIDEKAPFVLETEASNIAFSSVLNQFGKPSIHVLLMTVKRRLHSIEKEALAIVDTVKKWKHLLRSSHFTIVTDRCSVPFTFDVKHAKKFGRFLWSFARPDMESSTVINCPGQFFSTFGLPNHIYSNQSPSLISELQLFLHKRGVVTSRTNGYNPRRNGQTEGYNGVLRQSIIATLHPNGAMA